MRVQRPKPQRSRWLRVHDFSAPATFGIFITISPKSKICVALAADRLVLKLLQELGAYQGPRLTGQRSSRTEEPVGV
jgi:hypothetical protein